MQGCLESIGVDTGKGAYYRSGGATHCCDECHQRRAIANRLHARAVGDIVGSTTDDYDGACRACQLLGRLHGIVGALAAVYALALDVGIHECHNLRGIATDDGGVTLADNLPGCLCAIGGGSCTYGVEHDGLAHAMCSTACRQHAAYPLGIERTDIDYQGRGDTDHIVHLLHGMGHYG